MGDKWLMCVLLGLQCLSVPSSSRPVVIHHLSFHLFTVHISSVLITSLLHLLAYTGAHLGLAPKGWHFPSWKQRVWWRHIPCAWLFQFPSPWLLVVFVTQIHKVGEWHALEQLPVRPRECQKFQLLLHTSATLLVADSLLLPCIITTLKYDTLTWILRLASLNRCHCSV